ncbi:PH domain-containing protein [Spirosoma validum]|uniref:PH domain-containing protein n=1 Tax=Spirosoma validum TaxID=2771355 RepID=A0A927GBW1_9BACT|nr:PH domain-containing protein [Spirosoma validum]MBD2752018.1 PH domain-containing protein [Spirosoma validum]
MGLFDKVASAAADKFNKEVQSLLIQGETLENIMQLFEDYIAFTNKRIIFVDRKFIGSSRAIVSIPYAKISEVGMTSGGFMKFSQELAVQVGSHRHEFKVYDPKETAEVYKALVAKIC